MSLIQVAEALVPFVSAAEVKMSARVFSSSENETFERVTAGAMQAADGPDGYLQRALITQKWRLIANTFDCVIPLGNLQSIDAIKYLDADGVEQTLDPTVYRRSAHVDRSCAMLRPGQSWPTTEGSGDSVRIEFTAGYGDTPDDIPTLVRQATVMLAVHYWQNPSVTIGDPRLTEVSRKVELGYQWSMDSYILKGRRT